MEKQKEKRILNFAFSKGRIGLSLLLFVTACVLLVCENSGADKKRDSALFNLLTENSASTYVCADPQPAFSSLNAQGSILAQCASCHSGSTINANVDVTSYSSLHSETVSGNANQSVLYRVLLPGNIMSPYTTSALNQAVYCWIQGGANP